MKKNLFFLPSYSSICIGYLLGIKNEILAPSARVTEYEPIKLLLRYIDNDYVEEINTDSLIEWQ